MSTNDISEIKYWLQSVLVNEQLTDFSVDVLGNSEKGDGYMGDVVFVNVIGQTADNESKNYNLVLKCSKRSQALRDSIPIKETFEQEIYVYSEIFPACRRFQIEKGVQDIFDSVPRYYGKFVSDNMEVLALQNIKVIGYRLYDRKKPLTLDHINLLMREYGKWHAISAAMQQQEPEKFKQLTDGMVDLWKKYIVCTDLNTLFGAPVDEIYDLTKDDLTKSSAEKLKNLRNEINYIIGDLVRDETRFRAVCHGDNWNNNYMFKYEETDDTKPVNVVMLDWQISNFASPVLDLSYFLYACISKEDLPKFEDILKEYHNSFSDHLKKLGGDAEKIFSFENLMADWKLFGRNGFLMALSAVKIAVSDSDEIQDIAETADIGQDFSSAFVYETKDKEKLKDRALAIIEHAAEMEVI